jgi:hypothetical protein
LSLPFASGSRQSRSCKEWARLIRSFGTSTFDTSDIKPSIQQRVGFIRGAFKRLPGGGESTKRVRDRPTARTLSEVRWQRGDFQ